MTLTLETATGKSIVPEAIQQGLPESIEKVSHLPHVFLPSQLTHMLSGCSQLHSRHQRSQVL